MASVKAGKAKDRGTQQKLLRQQAVLAQFGELALQSEDLDKILTEACRLVGEALNTDLAKVVELQEDKQTLLVRAGVGWKPGVVGGVRLRADETSSEGHALRTGEPVISANIDEEERFHYPAFLIDNGVKALVNVPIIGAGGQPPFGILQVDSRTPRRFTEEDVGFLRSYANLLAAAVARLRIIGDLRGSIDRQQAALGTGLIGFFEWDVRAGMVTADRHFASFCGIDPVAAAAGVPLDALFAAIHPADRAEVEANVGTAVASLTDYVTEFRVVHPGGEVRWVVVRSHCYEQAKGRPVRYTGTAVDVTASKSAEEALRRANDALEARVADRTRELTAANAKLRAEAKERERTREALRQAREMGTLVEHLPMGAGLIDRSGRIILANPEFRRLLPRTVIPSGDTAVGSEWVALDPSGRRIAPSDYPGARALRGEVTLNVDLLHRDGPAGERWLRVSGIPVFNDDAIVAALLVIVDIDDEKRATERQDLLTREVDHRAKNMLAVVQAALRLTQADDVGGFVRTIEGRIAALARAQTLLAADRWSGADLHALLRGELSAFLDTGTAELRGPRLALPAEAAQPFSMAVHELATNATKYGALSSATGRLSVEWHIAPPPDDLLRLRWVETGGPPPDNPPSRQGFGSRVLNGTLQRQLSGSICMAWEKTGLVCAIEVPLGQTKWTTGAEVRGAAVRGAPAGENRGSCSAD